jgi:hypothetical protein
MNSASRKQQGDFEQGEQVVGHLFERRATGAVEQDITMECVDSRGRTQALDTIFTYEQTDPYAVTIRFLTRAGDLPWTFSRDLLARGLTDPAGDGDVHVSPGIGDDGRAVVYIELSSPDGQLLPRARTHDVYRFVTRSVALVPHGTESQHLRIDEVVTRLLAP